MNSMGSAPASARPPAGSLSLANGLVLPPDVVGSILRSAAQISFFGKFACISRELQGVAVWRHLDRLDLAGINSYGTHTVAAIVATLTKYVSSLTSLRRVNLPSMRQWDAFWPLLDQLKDQLTHVTIGFAYRGESSTPTEAKVPFSKKALEHLSVGPPLFPWAMQCVTEGYPHLKSLKVEAPNAEKAIELLNALASTAAPIAKLDIFIQSSSVPTPMEPFLEASYRAYQALNQTLQTVALPFDDDLFRLVFGEPLLPLDANFVPNFIALHKIHPNKLRFGPIEASFWETYWRRRPPTGSQQEPDIPNIQAAFDAFHDSESLPVRLERLFGTLHIGPEAPVLKWVFSKAQEFQASEYVDPLSFTTLMEGYSSVVELSHKPAMQGSCVDVAANAVAALKAITLQEPGLLKTFMSCFTYSLSLRRVPALEAFLRDISWGQKLGLDVNQPFLGETSFADALSREPNCLDALADQPGLNLSLKTPKGYPLNAFCAFIFDQSPHRISAVHKILRRYFEDKSTSTRDAFKAAVKAMDSYSLRPLLAIEPICDDFVAFFSSIEEATKLGIPNIILGTFSPEAHLLDTFFTSILIQNQDSSSSGTKMTPKQRNLLVEEYVWVAAFKLREDRFGSAVGAIMKNYGRICDSVQDLMRAKIQSLHGVNRVDVVRQIIRANAKSFSGSDSNAQALNRLRPTNDPTPKMDW